jgi:hypothetical protein
MTQWWTALVLVSGFFLADGGKLEMKEFSSKEGRFKVLLSGTPKEISQTVRDMTVRMYVVAQKDGVYLVSYNDMPAIALRGGPDAILDGARDGAVGNLKAKLTTSSKITLARKHPGREFSADLPDKKGSIRSRVYLVGDRMYQTQVIGTSSLVDSADTSKFLDSFKVTE